MATINKIKVGDATYDLQSNLSVTTSGSGSMVSNVAYNTTTKGLTVTKSNPQEAYITFGGPNKSGDITPVDMATMENFSANRLALAKAAGITIEYSNDGGTTFTDYGASDSQKIGLVSSQSVSFALGKRTTSNTGIDADQLRITLNATNMGVYTKAQKLYINYNSNGLASTKCVIETSNKGSETTWTKFGEYAVAGWSGWNSIPLGFAFGGGTGQTTNKANIRLTFIGTHNTTGNYTKCIGQVLNLAISGSTYWATPSNLAKTGHMYTWDASKNTIFSEGGVSIGKTSGPSSSYKLDVNGAINGTSVYSNGKQVIDTIKMQGSSTALAVSSGTVVIPTVAGEKGADGISIGTITATATSVASNVAPSVTVSQVTSDSNKNATFAFSIPKGANGVGVGTVTATVASAAPTATPTVTVSSVTSGSNKNCTFAFTLPKGADGTNGTNGTNGISVGTVTATVASVASNVAPSVTVNAATSDSNKNVTMAFKLPKGDTGATGPSGVVSVVTAGSGNAVTSGSYNSATKTVTLTKGSTFLTSSSLGNYLPLSGGTMNAESIITIGKDGGIDMGSNGVIAFSNGSNGLISSEAFYLHNNVNNLEYELWWGSPQSGNVSFITGLNNKSAMTFTKLIPQFVAGMYCQDDPEKLVIIGNGSSTTARSNALTIDTNGLLAAKKGYSIVEGTSSQFLKADGSVDSNSYLTSASLSGYAKTSDLSSYIPLSGSSAITGNLISDTKKICNLGSSSSSWSNAYLSSIYTDDIHAEDEGTDIDIYSNYTDFYSYDGDLIADIRYESGSYSLNVYKNSGDDSVKISEDKITVYNANGGESVVINGDSQEVELGSNQITTQDTYLALKLRGNELCLGNNATTSATNLVVNYRPITGCGTFAGFILRAGSATSLANLQCGALTATSVKLSSGTANQVLMANGSVRNAHSTSGNSGIYNAIPFIKSDGVMEVGKYIDFHQTDTGTDYDTRITCENGLTVSKAVTAPAFYQISDIRKKDIKEEISLDKCYDLIDKCQTIIYSLKDQTKEQIGMIAQEVEEFFPEVIQTDEEGFKSLDYSRLVVICFKVLKDLIKRVSKLEEK